MNGRRTTRGNGFRSKAGLWRFPRLSAGRDSAPSRHALNAFVILAILIAVATVLIAPSIDMPDTVLREHFVASHSAGVHATSPMVSAVISVLLVVHAQQSASRSSVTLQSTKSDYKQSSAVMRC